MSGNLQPSIDAAEHIGPDSTGDNIYAKRVANYIWNGSGWERQPATIEQGPPTSNGSGWLVAPDTDYQSGFSASSLNTNVFEIDVRKYKSFCIQILGTFSATVTLQGTLDGSRWDSIGGKFSNSLSNMYVSTFASPGMVEGPVYFNNIRLRITAFTSGTVQANILLSSAPHFPTSMGLDTELPGGASAADNDNNPSAPYVRSANSLFNGSTWDRQRNNLEATLLSSLARTVTTNSTDQTNYNAKGVQLVLNVTAQPGGAETLSLKIQGKDSVSGNYFDIVDAGVLFTATTGTKALTIYPGILAADYAAGDTAKAGAIPRTWRAVVTHSSIGSWTYSLAGTLII